MTRILTPKQFENREVPILSSFRQTVRLMAEEFPFCSEILAATVFGSYITNQHELSSDLNLAIYYKGDPIKLGRQLKNVVKLAGKKNVPLSIITIPDTVSLNEQKYYFGSSPRSMLHVFEVGTGDIKESVSAKLRSDINLVDSAKIYLAGRLRTLREGSAFYRSISQHQQHQVLAESFTAVVTGLRLVLLALKVPPFEVYSPTSSALLELLKRYGGTNELYFFEEQMKLLASYHELVKKSTVSVKSYERFLLKIRRRLPASIDFLEFLMRKID